MNVIQTFFFLNYSLKTAVTKSALTNLSNYFYYLIYVDDDDYSFKKNIRKPNTKFDTRAVQK